MDKTIGAVRALFAGNGWRNPYPHYAVLRERTPVCPLPLDAVAISRYDDCARVLRDPVFRMEDAAWLDRSMPGWNDHPALRSLMCEMVNHNPPHHERLRRLVSKGFTPRRIAALRPAIERLVERLLDRMADTIANGGTADFMSEFALPLPVTVIGELLGIPDEDRTWFAPRVEAFTEAIETRMTGPPLAAADSAVTELWQRLRELVDLRRRDPRDDLVSALVSVADADADRLGTDELLANLLLLYAAGYETTSNLLGNGLAALLDRPALMERLYRNPQLTREYVEEMMRYDPPIQVATRYAGEDTEIGGQPIGAGTWVIILIGAANRDGARFRDPDVFDPERANSDSLGFGMGAHYCVGSALARLETQVAFTKLLGRFGRIAYAGDPVRRRMSLRGFHTLPITARLPHET